MINDSKEIDILGSWLSNEILFCGNLGPDKCVDLMLLEPFWSQKPWTRYLKGKKIVVVHPFKEDILSQYYNHRSQLFDNPMILPEFASLRVVKAVQSLGGENNGFRDWFEALQWMKDEIDKENYDVCLIGCGAYGFPLAAHVKRQGKQAIHLGGVLQLFFGIKGKRWNDKAQSHLYNKYWCSPISKPINYKNIEGGCYW